MMKKVIFICSLIFIIPAEAKVLTKPMLVKQVKANFPEILIQQEKIIQAQEKTRSARGVFDPSFDGKFNSVPTGGYENVYFEGTLDYPIENTGNTLTAGYRIGRGDWPIYYQDYLTNSYGDTFIGFNMPLLRNRFIDKARQNILKNIILTESESLLLSIKKNEVIAQAIDVYFEWIKSSYRLNIAKTLLEIAKERQIAIDKQAALGDIAKIDQVENRRLIMQRKSVLTSERQKYVSAKNKLRFYLGDAFNLDGKNAWCAPSLERELVKYRNNKTNFNRIKQYQPYINYLETQINKSKLAIKQAINEMRPGFDVSLFLDKQHGKGNSKLSETSLNFGLKYKLPLRLRKAQGQVAQNKSIIREYNFHKSLFTRKLKLMFRNILNDINALTNMYHLRSQEVMYAEQLENAERKKFAAGDSSLFLVNQREQTVASTRFLVVDAFIKYKQRVNLLSSLCFYRKKCVLAPSH